MLMMLSPLSRFENKWCCYLVKGSSGCQTRADGAVSIHYQVQLKAKWRPVIAFCLTRPNFLVAPDAVKPNHTHSQAYSNTESTSPTYRDVNNLLAYHHPEDAAVTWYTCSVVMLTILSPPSAGHPPTQLPNWFHYQERSHWQWPLNDQWWRKLNIKHIFSLTAACCQLRFLSLLSLGILMSLFPATVCHFLSTEYYLFSLKAHLLFLLRLLLQWLCCSSGDTHLVSSSTPLGSCFVKVFFLFYFFLVYVFFSVKKNNIWPVLTVHENSLCLRHQYIVCSYQRHYSRDQFYKKLCIMSKLPDHTQHHKNVFVSPYQPKLNAVLNSSLIPFDRLVFVSLGARAASTWIVFLTGKLNSVQRLTSPMVLLDIWGFLLALFLLFFFFFSSQ